MNVPPSALTITRIASIYGMSRQNFYQLCSRHGIAQPTWRNPDLVLCHLLDSGAVSPLRTRLTDPDERARIKTELSRP